MFSIFQPQKFNQQFLSVVFVKNKKYKLFFFWFEKKTDLDSVTKLEKIVKYK